ncbi:flagellar hook-associated protein 3 [Roseateles sp. DAIF2]|uniref:flagellar hook-associated protein FlgL n=1 Tax=Roseateles sp. DAIF2 TaxID=2714952 RepID=UPI0018A2ABCF|nr:flagellar hook-associated protein FlgL [Roseateles sp. DAIF2]QPF74146.1 flagellar hook-associated protein 3 [Roseateles sp. DAIF2]
MRIASNQYHATMNTALQAANSGLAQVMQQMASGNRIQVPSDDTIATVRLARLSREESALGQFRDNIGALQSRLRTSEVTLGSMEQDMMMARDLLVWAADGGNTPEDLKAMSASLATLRDSLFHVANSKNAEGRYLFSGTATLTDTVLFNGGAAAGSRYSAGAGINADLQQVSVGTDITVAGNVPLNGYYDFLNKLDLVVTDLAAGNPISSAPLTDLDNAMNDVSGKISELGRRQNILQTLDDNHASVSLSNKQSALDLGALDYAEASVRLNSYTLAVQATQKAYAKVSNLSLFNVL